MLIFSSRYFLFSVIGIFFTINDACAGRLQLTHADSAVGRMENGRLVRELIGNVVFSQDSAHMYCDRAVHYLDDRIICFFGNVLIENPPRQLRAEEIYYFEDGRQYLARGRARLVDRWRVLTADSLRYLEPQEQVLAHGNVCLDDVRERMQLRSMRMEYLRLAGFARAVGRPVFVHVDSSGADSLVIISDYMEMKNDGAEVEAIDRVQVRQGRVYAVCGKLKYARDREEIELTLDPRAQRDEDRLRGNTITLKLAERTIQAIFVKGQGMVLSRVDTLLSREALFDFLSGEEIYVRLQQQRPDSMFIKGRATSYYHLFEQKQNKGLNKVVGDELYMKLSDGKLKWVEVVSSPAASTGLFHPQGQEVALVDELQKLIAPMLQPMDLAAPSAMGLDKQKKLSQLFD